MSVEDVIQILQLLVQNHVDYNEPYPLKIGRQWSCTFLVQTTWCPLKNHQICQGIEINPGGNTGCTINARNVHT